MTEKLKNYVGVAVGVSVLLLGFAAWNASKFYGQSIDPTTIRSFSVSSEGKVVGIPDIATFSFAVVKQGGTEIAELQQESVTITNEVIAFLKSNGVDPKDIQTEQYSLEPRYQYYNCGNIRALGVGPCPPPEIVGYTLTQTASVKIRDFTKIGDIIGGVVSHGANTVSELSFVIDDPEKLQAEARDEAIKRAQEKATAIARAGGFSVGRLLSIDEGGYTPFPKYQYARLEAADGSAAFTPPTIEPGSEEVRVIVTLRYEIQ